MGNQDIYQNLNFQFKHFKSVHILFVHPSFLTECTCRKGVLVICCYITNHPQRLRLKILTIILLLLRVLEEGVRSLGMAWLSISDSALSCGCSQMVSGTGVEWGCWSSWGLPRHLSIFMQTQGLSMWSLYSWMNLSFLTWWWPQGY